MKIQIRNEHRGTIQPTQKGFQISLNQESYEFTNQILTKLSTL